MEYYSYIVVFHILAMISWMAMMFYLPRLFVYHQEHKENKGFLDVIKIQEYKLYTYIGLPAKIATIVSAVALIVIAPELLKSGGWLHAKITLGVILVAYSFSLNHYRKKLLNDECYKSGKFFRIYNEVPTIIAIAMVSLVVLKPF
jgi:putative membrane protein